MFCIHCGTKNDPSSRFCTGCSSPLVHVTTEGDGFGGKRQDVQVRQVRQVDLVKSTSGDIYICPVCYSKNEDHRKYCVVCGTWLLSEYFPAKKYKSGSNSRVKVKSSGQGSTLRVASFIVKTLFVVGFLFLGLSILFSPDNEMVLGILTSVFLLSLFQLIFGLIHPSLIVGGFNSRLAVLLVYGFLSIFSLVGMGRLDMDSIEQAYITGVEQKSDLGQQEVVEGSEESYKGQSVPIPYTDLVRNPDKYKGRRVVYTGSVVQVVFEQKNNVHLRVALTKGDFGVWDDIIYVTYSKPSGGDRILEGDIVQLWGEVKGLYTGKTIFGDFVAIPEVSARYLTINPAIGGSKNGTR